MKKNDGLKLIYWSAEPAYPLKWQTAVIANPADMRLEHKMPWYILEHKFASHSLLLHNACLIKIKRYKKSISYLHDLGLPQLLSGTNKWATY